ncbi:hypothetical protein PV04_06021 [Phialophora macrospora]|uniref:Transcription factor domain-containing protein n=1 Tax=Phialophora macrospora TaxID=1851006 RepID=A0A0D2DX81_9EURO|nr:hypothetical protein PV04_06021 [Phialophora macrospora]
MSLAKQSYSTSITPLPGTFGLFDPPSPLGLHFLNLWGQNQSNHMHCRAIQQIIRSRSGLANAGIETPGFADALYQFDLLESAKTLTRPWMDMPSARWRFLTEKIASSREGLGRDVRDKFVQALPRTSDYTPFLDILSDMCVYCSWIQAVQDQMEPGSVAHELYTPLIRDLSVLRDTIEHRLLAYRCTGNSIEEQLCWAAALIFTHCVIYPLPNRQPLDILLDRLMASLGGLVVEHVDEGRPFLVWVSMIGAMACQPADQARTPFFSERLTTYAAAAGVSSWFQLRGLLGDFLWLDRACGMGGLTIWDRSSNPVTDLDGL